MSSPPPAAQERLVKESNIWLASVRPDGRPHLVPIWFVWHAGRLYLCTTPGSVKTYNIAHNPHVALALEGGNNPVICEGRAVFLSKPWPADIVTAFKGKFDWDLNADTSYSTLIEVMPVKWLAWESL